jgi:dihydroorotate dehydrogenase
MYKLLQPILFLLPPEAAHAVTMALLKVRGLFFSYKPKISKAPITLMGIEFPNRVGLAAGLDKNGDYILPLAKLGFGFIEIGTLTPEPQPGNPKPRIFRLKKQQAIINRMGFPNKGIDHAIRQIQNLKHRPIIGVNIGKNKDTEIEDAADDYMLGMQKAYPYADYITVNISSPNTENLRELQNEQHLQELLSTLKNMQHLLNIQYDRYVPLVVKIAPDLTAEQLKHIADVLLETQIDGVIATNTTVQRPNTESAEQGGLSGAPLSDLSTQLIMQLCQLLGGKVPIIAAGGIMHKADAEAKLAAGASLVQLYTGLIYQGPGLVKEIASSSIKR